MPYEAGALMILLLLGRILGMCPDQLNGRAGTRALQTQSHSPDRRTPLALAGLLAPVGFHVHLVTSTLVVFLAALFFPFSSF